MVSYFNHPEAIAVFWYTLSRHHKWSESLAIIDLDIQVYHLSVIMLNIFQSWRRLGFWDTAAVDAYQRLSFHSLLTLIHVCTVAALCLLTFFHSLCWGGHHIECTAFTFFLLGVFCSSHAQIIKILSTACIVSLEARHCAQVRWYISAPEWNRSPVGASSASLMPPSVFTRLPRRQRSRHGSARNSRGLPISRCFPLSSHLLWATAASIQAKHYLSVLPCTPWPLPQGCVSNACNAASWCPVVCVTPHTEGCLEHSLRLE